MTGVRLALLAPLLVPAGAHAEPAQCHVVDVELQPNTSDLQIVAWIEDAAGHYVDTVFITQETGRYGLGNRPGRYDFNSGPQPTEAATGQAGHRDMWPYGRRITVFPVWSHRHGMAFPEVVFQDGDENNLSHPYNNSSHENHFCRPLSATEPAWDAITCASSVYTDKGILSPTLTTGYPPRSDVVRQGAMDTPDVDMYAALDPFDAVSSATPPGGAKAEISWPIPKNLPMGDFVLWVEVSREFDFNATYNSMTYPAPTGIPWADFGMPYRGQPSVIYQVPFTIGTTETFSMAHDYAGYGDPTGGDGTLRPPDSTITVGVGTGGGRLDLLADGAMTYRVRVDARPEYDSVAPGTPSAMSAAALDGQTATVSFVAPGNDGLVGTVTGYDVRYRAGSELTAANFDASTKLDTVIAPLAPGSQQTVELDNLLPDTEYWIGVRAYDACRNTSEIAIANVTTPDRQAGEVNACFIATAAYGSAMANDVQTLRRFRDGILRASALGELAIETYYTFGPPVAGVVGESEVLRATARDILSPFVARARSVER